MAKFVVKDCHSCPFADIDNEYGHACQHPFNFDAVAPKNGVMYLWLPSDTIHQNCPLKKDPITVKIDCDE